MIISQLDEEFFETHSDYIIHNNGKLDTVNGISKEVSDKIKDYCARKQDPATTYSVDFIKKER